MTTFPLLNYLTQTLMARESRGLSLAPKNLSERDGIALDLRESALVVTLLFFPSESDYWREMVRYPEPG